MSNRKAFQEDGTPGRIAAAAVAEFAEKGYDGASVRDIARRAGLTEGAMYRHFESKEALARQIFQTNIEAWSAGLEAAIAGTSGFAAQLRAMVAFFCRAFDGNRGLFAFLLLNQHGPARATDPARPNPFAIVERRVAAAIKAGELAPGDSGLRSAAILGAVYQAALHVLHRRPELRLVDHLPEIAASALRAAGPVSPSR